MDVTNAGRLPQLAAQLVAWRERARVVASFVKEGQCAGTSVGKPRFGGGRLGRIGEAPWDGSGHRYAEMTSQLTAARSRYGAAVEMPFLPRYAENVHRIMRPAADDLFGDILDIPFVLRLPAVPESRPSLGAAQLTAEPRSMRLGAQHSWG